MGFSEYSGQKPSDVQAEQLTEQRTIITPNGPVTGEEGDWEVREPGGRVRHLTDEEFQKEYGSGADTADSDSAPEESVYDSGETGSYGPSDTETSVDRDAPKADIGTPTEESDEKSDSDEQSEDDTGKTGDEAEESKETPAAPRRPPRRR